MFSLRKPSSLEITERVADVAASGQCAQRFLSATGGARTRHFPALFSHDCSVSQLGVGAAAFAAARNAFNRWGMFDLGWVRVVNADAQIVPGQIVAVEAHTLGLWSLNFSRILEVVDAASAFGFLYSTTQFHVEDGEERFLLTLDEASGAVTYTLEAVSRPQNKLASLGFPIARAFQHKFARDSHRRMRDSVSAAPRDLRTDTLKT